MTPDLWEYPCNLPQSATTPWILTLQHSQTWRLVGDSSRPRPPTSMPCATPTSIQPASCALGVAPSCDTQNQVLPSHFHLGSLIQVEILQKNSMYYKNNFLTVKTFFRPYVMIYHHKLVYIRNFRQPGGTFWNQVGGQAYFICVICPLWLEYV